MTDASTDTHSWHQPAETTPHQCTFMAVPNSTSAHGGELLHDAQSEIINIANAIAEFEPLLLFSSLETLDDVQSKVHKNVSVLHAEETSHLWIRDFGPIFVKSPDGKAVRGINFNFNYWGNKRMPSGDESLARIGAQRITGTLPLGTTLVAEGGGMDVDGEGTFLSAESAVVNNNQNPGKTRAEIETELSRLLGVKKFLWLAGENGKDTTDRHVDALARFVSPGNVVLSRPSPENPGRYVAAYEDAKARLVNATDAQGRPLVLHDCTEPDSGKLENVADGDIIASYVNFLAVNGGVIILRFGDEERDAEALALFQKLYPDRKVVQVYINALPRIGGGLHCATQQVPAAS
ncbi:related to peptidylarginine deiminase and related enzymes [Cephalotrichum gorgonifer]|uniref:Related to peptidylarginine deiminase and related enzymes n=1 Tax=Cephalotrichum gorgonifer TaxID=2041049 RepID=A0AAE8MYQ0_9PEZI|nr:related to peptidylarginine deiminase and related enzymes [Cephalotrichum gorgonifer]